MKILILGGDGQIGHQLFKHFRGRHETKATLRGDLTEYEKFGMFTSRNVYPRVDVRVAESLMAVAEDFQPEAVINAVGITNKRPEATDHIACIEINALLPHRLASFCKTIGARLVHLSTDCVFSGHKGNYGDDESSDADDLYGRSKALGEVREGHCITLRTSHIGRELSRKTGLLEWFLAQHGQIRGFKRAIFSGLTTLELSRVVEHILLNYPQASGLYNVSSEPISKFSLLMLLKEKMGLPIEIIPDETFHCDRSLDSTKFRREFNYTPPSWEEMADELIRDI
jgi:dTDP-4-dehydrorhamnose reductase